MLFENSPKEHKYSFFSNKIFSFLRIQGFLKIELIVHQLSNSFFNILQQTKIIGNQIKYF